MITDHLGNTRVRFHDDNGNGTISSGELLSTHDYYPFGMEWNVGSYQYLYNGKELNEDFGLNWLDYGARWYDPAIARWNAVDPLKEQYFSLSPYNYTNNNPIRYIDPNGMYFTERSQKYLDKLNDEMDSREAWYDKRIAKAKAKGKDNKVDRLSKKKSILKSNFDEIRQEIEILKESDQGYDIYVDANQSIAGPVYGTGTKRGGFNFNFSTGMAEIFLPDGHDIGFIAHELKHAYQFEVGEFSVGPKLRGQNSNFFYDKFDEQEAYKRGSSFSQISHSAYSLPEVYNNVELGPVDVTTHPATGKVLAAPMETQKRVFTNLARVTRHAFRANGKTYYYKR